MGAKPKSKGNTSKLKSSKSKDKDKSKDKKSSKEKEDKKKSDKSKSKSKGKDKSKKSDMPKVKDEKDLGEIITKEEQEKIEKANLIQNLSLNNQPHLSTFQLNNIPIPTFQEKCEGCYQGDGVVFCTECGKIFCKTCDDQLHVIPSFRNHERIPLEALSETKMKCYHHNQPLRLFCESCHEPICNKCQKMGPHNTPLHQISSLFQVYKKFLDIGKNYINGPLKEKSSRIEELMLQIDNLLNDSKSKAKEILHGISAEYESVIEKINKLDGNKKAELSFNSSEFQKDMLNIQRILEILNKKNLSYYSNDNGGNILPMEEDENDRIINFLLQYKTLINEIDQLISKPINKIMTKEDEEKILKWPKELNDSKEKLILYEKYKRLIKVKDDIIWKLLTTPYEEKPSELFEIEKKTKEEISKWTQLIEKTKLELSKYNLVCAYCGLNLENGMNSLCPINNPQSQFENKNFTNDTPPEQAHGTDKHFFAEPTEEYLKKIDNGELNDINNIFKKKENPMNTSGNLKDSKKSKSNKSINDLMRPSISSDWVNKSARIIEKENINLFQVLSEIDIRGTGYLNIRELIRGMEKIRIILTEEDKNSLKRYLQMSGINENKIDIKNFAQNFGKTTMYDNLCGNSNSKFSNSRNSYSNSKNNVNNENYPQNSSNGFKGYKHSNNNSNNFGDTIPKNMTYPQMNPIINNEQGYQTGYN